MVSMRSLIFGSTTFALALGGFISEAPADCVPVCITVGTPRLTTNLLQPIQPGPTEVGCPRDIRFLCPNEVCSWHITDMARCLV